MSRCSGNRQTVARFVFCKMMLTINLVRWPHRVCAELLTRYGQLRQSASRSDTQTCPFALQPLTLSGVAGAVTNKFLFETQEIHVLHKKTLIALAAAVALGCVPMATNALAAGHPGGGHGGGASFAGHGGGGGGHAMAGPTRGGRGSGRVRGGGGGGRL